MNYFELFHLPFDFDVKTALLTDTYRELQRAVHPDKFAHASEHEQLLAVQKSAQVNDAYETLKDPLRRAEYMLAEQDIDIQIEQKTLQDPAFLMQQMEYREQLEDIAAMSDDDKEQAIEDFEAQLKELTQALYAELAPKLVSSCKVTLESAAVCVRKLKFMRKLRDELNRLEEALH